MGLVIGIIIIITVFTITFVLCSNRFNLVIIKIDKAEEDIDLYLQKKKELLGRAKTIIQKELKSDDIMVELDNLGEEVNNFQTHNFLKIIYNELFKLLDENEKLLKSDNLVKILEELNDTEEDIVGAIKFYNDTVVEFNQLVVSFPSKIVALFKRYKKKEFYKHEKREIFEILNEK